MKVLVAQSFRLSGSLWTVARKAPLSMVFSRQEYWSGLPCPPPADPFKPESPALQAQNILVFFFFLLLILELHTQT